MDSRTIVRYFAVFIIGAAGGYLYAGAPASTHSADTHEDSAQAEDHAQHEMYEVPASVPTPSVNLVAHKDSVGGWNLNITTQNFRFAPQNAGNENVPGEGHAHLFVDDIKVARVYGNWFHLGALPEGEHTIEVTLNTNDHANYAVNGETIAASVEVTEAPKEEMVMMEATGEEKMFHIEIVEKAITSGETTLTVNQGDTVTIMVMADEAEEFHVHGYDVSIDLMPGEMAEATFVAGASGRFPFELEESKTELGALEVQP